jgi:predicted aspartyl protease
MKNFAKRSPRFLLLVLIEFGKISLLSVVLFTISAPVSEFLLSPRAIAQESDGCFMIDSSGRRIDLGALCNRDAQQTLPRSQPQPASATTTSDGVVQVKIKRRARGTPVIDVTFNHNQTFEMILDTGASGTLITARMANSLQLQTVGVINATIADGRKVQFPVGIIGSMSVGSASVSNVPVAISDQIDVGLLGHDFFENFDIKIKKDTVEFYPR